MIITEAPKLDRVIQQHQRLLVNWTGSSVDQRAERKEGRDPAMPGETGRVKSGFLSALERSE